MQTRIGKPAPLGPTWDGRGVNFAVLAPDATAVELSLFADRSPSATERRHPMARGADGVWHLFVDRLEPGQAYGFRGHGPWDPDAGHLFNPAKLLVDPRSRAVSGAMTWNPALVAGCDKASGTGSEPCPLDSAPYCPRSIVVDPAFDWGGDTRPRVPWPETVIYECHVRGLTRRHPEVPEPDRGRFAGLAHPSVTAHLRSLGVTTVELMPVQQFVSEPHLQRRGLVNYWGYNPLALMAPHSGYAADDNGSQVAEFKSMVRALHSAGLEVVLDIVLNHSAEGDLAGPTLGLRGLANAVSYRHREGAAYEDFTGCGNTLDLRRDGVRRLVLDCLRYWVGEMRVDGFRLDLAPTLGRQSPGFAAAAPFFAELAADAELRRAKWIAEPWDVGPGGYQLGAFPAPFAEWNDQFRDASRGAWRGDPDRLAELPRRLAGSRDLFGSDRGEQASVNYVTAHDGFTLVDLTSYEERRNHANGEDNRDGHRHTLSRNWGEEGPSRRSDVRLARERARRNLVATLALADGVPMLSHGDELGRTQGGNNNAYCQDSPTTWVDWRRTPEIESWLDFVRRCFDLRRRLRREFAAQAGSSLAWSRRDGSGPVCLALRPAGSSHDLESPWLVLNPGPDACRFRLPRGGGEHRVALATFDPPTTVDREVELPPYSLLVLEPHASRSPNRE